VFRYVMLLKAALRAIRRNKLRSSLTVLGIIIGVGAVIAMVGIGEGASNLVKAQISSLGDNLITIHSEMHGPGGRSSGGGSGAALTEADAEAITSQVPAVTQISPVTQAGVMVIYGNQNWSTQVYGGNASIFDIRRWPVVKGSGFNDSAVRGTAKVAVLGQTVVDQLFGGGDPIGATIRINKMPFIVIGVLDKKGQNSWGRDQDDTIFVPYTTVMKRLSGQTSLSMILASAASMQDLPEATAEITALLRQRHRLPPGDEEPFSVRTQQDLSNVMGSTSQVMRTLLAVIASVSLVVGGIGIMNIMLVSVTERTREIGIRMAVGAKGWHVMVQFLSEAVILSCIGGLLGIVLGVGAGKVVEKTMRWPIDIQPHWILLAFGVAAAVGILFGFWPARKASRLDPIEALRYE
jgi:putative ABC transport system permease protein